LPEGIDSGNHRVPIENPGDVVCNSGGEFALAADRQVAEQGKTQFATDEGKGVSVEEKKRSATVELSKEVEGLKEAYFLVMGFFPETFARCSNLRVKSML
jgi:hypothetical protein